jgi:myo-inositol catabolism protein IolC
MASERVVAGPLCILRFDHRTPFERNFLGLEGGRRPDNAQHARVTELKRIVFDGLLEVVRGGVDPSAVIVVLDEEYSTTIAEDALDRGIPIGLTVEKSGGEEFELEYGEEFAGHIDRFHPDHVKALTRYNPAGDQELNARQRQRLSELSAWTTAHGYPLMLELMIPPTAEQLAAAGDEAGFERDVLPGLLEETVATLVGDGINAETWMIPGLATPTASARAVAALRDHAGSDVRCAVLGQGPDGDRVIEWIRTSAAAGGYDGLAVAQTVWGPPLRALTAGTASVEEARAAVAEGLRRSISAFG